MLKIVSIKISYPNTNYFVHLDQLPNWPMSDNQWN